MSCLSIIFFLIYTKKLLIKKKKPHDRIDRAVFIIRGFSYPILFGIDTPLLFSQTFVIVVTPLCIGFGSSKEIFGLGRILFHY